LIVTLTHGIAQGPDTWHFTYIFSKKKKIKKTKKNLKNFKK